MLNAAMISKNLRNKIWAECANTATRLDTAMAEDAEKKSPYFLFYNQHPTFLQHLRTFGEIGIVTDHAKKKLRGKLEDCGLLEGSRDPGYRWKTREKVKERLKYTYLFTYRMWVTEWRGQTNF